MKKPDVPTSLFKFLSVLEDSVWICILAAYFVTSFLLWVFDHWSPYSFQNNMEGYAEDEEKKGFNKGNLKDTKDRYDQEKLVIEARNSPHWIEELNDDFDDMNEDISSYR